MAWGGVRMLKNSQFFRRQSLLRRSAYGRAQGGVVLLLTLVVLVAMTLGALALMRGVFTSNRVAANLAFQQSATQAAEVGIETAIAWLEQKSRELETAGSTTLANKLYQNITAGTETYNYVARREDPASTQTWTNFWTDTLEASGQVNTLAADAAGNTVSFVIHRLCNGVGGPTTGISCESSPTAVTSSTTSSMSNTLKLSSTSQVYFRITVRVKGPRNAVSFTQAVVAI